MVQRLWGHWSVGTSQMRSDCLQELLREHRVQEAAAEEEDAGVMSKVGGRYRGTNARRVGGG